MKKKILVFDSHPVQYRVPVWQEMERLYPGCLHVAYASDCSVRGYADTGFGKTFAWDEPLLTGYSYTILNCENGEPLSSWKSLTGKGIKRIIKDVKPQFILLTGLNFRYDLVAYLEARRNAIPVWLRYETQDSAFPRSKLKSVLRSVIYRIAYTGLDRIFFIGELNRKHYLRHGVHKSKLRRASYGTVDRFADMDEAEKKELRNNTRAFAKISASDFVVGFSGKFITKKNPEMLFEMLQHLPHDLQKRTTLYFIGSGPLENDLHRLAAAVLDKFNIRTFFAGFINQSKLAGHYLAMDVMVLPSRRMGETWGLVVNEAMQAGCAVVVSDAVGCSADFNSWERFKVFREGDAVQLSKYVAELAEYTTDFNWAQEGLKAYSIKSSAAAFLEEIAALENVSYPNVVKATTT